MYEVWPFRIRSLVLRELTILGTRFCRSGQSEGRPSHFAIEQEGTEAQVLGYHSLPWLGGHRAPGASEGVQVSRVQGWTGLVGGSDSRARVWLLSR